MSRQKKQKIVRQWFAWILCICIFLVNAGVMDTVLAKDGRNRIRETTASSSDAEPTTEEIETTAGEKEAETIQAASSSNSIIKSDPPVATDSDALAFAIVAGGVTWNSSGGTLNGRKAVMLREEDSQVIDQKQTYILKSKESCTDGDDSDPWMGDREDVIWHFFPQEGAPSDPHKLEINDNGKYTIYTEVKSEGQAEPEKRYLKIARVSEADPEAKVRNLLLVTDSNAASDFTVTRGGEKHPGRFSIVTKQDDKNIALTLRGGVTENGFCAYEYDGNYESEWLWLAPYKKVEKIDAVNHAGTVINLFDYWLDEQDASDSKILEDKKPFETPEVDRETGINVDHVLKFGAYLKDSRKYPGWDIYDNGDYNKSGVAPYADIVAPVLGADGYPRLSGDKDAFPFDDRDKLPNYGEGKYEESLRYLFDPKIQHEGKESHSNVDGLLQVDDDGYYYYDSQKNFASYNEKKNSLDLYNTWGVTHHSMSEKPHLYGQFFPFHTYEELGKTKSNDEKVKHYFGLTMTTRFVQKYGGHVDIEEKKDVIYEFSGDDDVWVFIDGVLVADLGGIHDKCSLSINFADGKIEILDGAGAPFKERTIKEAFVDAGKDVSEWESNTFADNTTHTLKFFYMERGNNDSNMKLKFNLIGVPETSISKVDQYDEAVVGARFAVYRSNAEGEYETEKNTYISLSDGYELDENTGIIHTKDGKKISPCEVHTTDKNGKIIFKDEDGGFSTIAELEERFGTHFILREIYVPDGYRPVSEEIHFQFQNGVIVSDDQFKTGVDVSGNELLTAPHTLYSYKGHGNEITYVGDDGSVHGTLFGVVLWYHGRMDGEGSIAKEEEWSPVYGDSKNGYWAERWDPETEGSIIPAVIRAAQNAEKYGQVVFKEAANGNMQLQAENLPGDPREYYFMLNRPGANLEEIEANTSYTLALYWTEADSLKEAKTNNTYRIIADEEDLQKYGKTDAYAFDRMFGSSIRIPDVMNRVAVQKMDTKEKPINDAKFALYPAKLEGGVRQYIAEDQTAITLSKDSDGDNSGEAQVAGQDGKYEYTVESGTGKIEVSPVAGSGSSYMIQPYKVEITKTNEPAVPGMEAMCWFDIPAGEFLLREIEAPEGYRLNTNDTFVYSSIHGVYADAGQLRDGISVACGPGYLVSTMEQFAGTDQIDQSLTWVFSRLKLAASSSIQNGSDLENHDQWPFATDRFGATTTDHAKAMRTYLKYQPDSKNGIFNYAVDTDLEKAENLPEDLKKGTGKRVLFTSVGWPYLEIYQNYGWGSMQDGIKVGENYQDLHGSDDKQYADLSHLFSRSVIIQVMDRMPDEPEYPPETPDPSEPSSSEEESTETGSSEESSSTEESSSNPSGSSEPDSSEESSTDPTGPTSPTDPTDPTAPTESTGVSVDVKKVWAGSGSHNHPAEVTVQLYQDRAAYGDPVILNDANGWQYVWTDLPSGADWTVDEVWIPAGYDKSVSREGNSWTIVNTRERPRDDDDDDDEPDETTRPDRTHPSDDPSRDSQPESDESRSEWETVTIEDTESLPMTAVYWTDESKPTDETRETTFIPRTGDSSHSILWILVLTGSVAGLGVILVWGFRNRKNEK